MPPQMIPAPLPDLPDSLFLRRRIINHFPAHPSLARRWFHSVSESARWAHEGFALWNAQNIPRRVYRRWLGNFAPHVYLWAWYSQRRGERAHALIEKHWTPEIGYQAAHQAATEWRERIELELQVGRRIVKDIWLRPGFFEGYVFIPIRSAAEMAEEAAAMRNCLRTYGYSVAHGHSRLWSIRRDGARAATLELVHRGNDPIPAIGQFQLAGNEEPSVELWSIVHRWIESQQPLPRFAAPAASWNSVGYDRETWVSLWKPYWLAKQHVPEWLPLAPTASAMDEL